MYPEQLIRRILCFAVSKVLTMEDCRCIKLKLNHSPISNTEAVWGVFTSALITENMMELEQNIAISQQTSQQIR